MIIVFVKSIDMKYRDINLLYAINFIEEYNYNNNNNNYGINTHPEAIFTHPGARLTYTLDKTWWYM
jgi:hypothetical protein